MKCLVCNKEFSGEICPRCNFPVIHFPGSTESGIKKIESTIVAYRKNFLKNVEISIKSYWWKDQGGTIVLDHTCSNSFGKTEELLGKKAFLEEKFAREREKTTLPISVEVKTGEKSRELLVEVPNLAEPELQQIGLELEENFRFRILLKNDAGSTSASAYQSVFEE